MMSQHVPKKEQPVMDLPIRMLFVVLFAVYHYAPLIAGAEPPYPRSEVIEDITWHWETHRTAAPGSDLWPVTWGPDGHLYAAWGDGGGFGGTNSEGRVSMGFARIEGSPESYQGVNVNGGKDCEHPASFPNQGKTGGILFVDGVLYARLNMQDGKWPDVNHALIWSEDLGVTWKQTSWVFPKGPGRFQPSRFLNFGRDYTGVPPHLDGFVYIYGAKQEEWGESGSTYLARVPEHRLREREAYEFLAGLVSGDRPVWSPDVTKLAPVFADPNGGTPATVAYVPALKRYLLASFHTGPGQLGIFDAPEPWGPWTTVAYYEDWGRMENEGHGLNCEFPQKWMSDDGRTLWCVFSVYGAGGQTGIQAHDKFNLVKVSLSLKR
jgi:hypothetical protein